MDMGLLRRLVGALVLLLSTGATVGCIAGIIGTWMMCQGVSESVQRIAGKLDAGLQRVSDANLNVQIAVGKARADVAHVGKASADLAESGKKSRLAARTIRGFIHQQAEPDMDELGGRLATLSDCAIAVSSLLASYQEVPLAGASRIDSDQFKRRADEARRLSSILRRVEVALGEGNTEIGRQQVAATTSEVDLFLRNCQTTISAWQSNLDEMRDDLSHVRAKVLRWLTWAAIAVTVLCAWIGAGQISLFAYALRWCRAG